ncbi:MAG: hypothetical protein V4628_11730 [Pseudomonadota bacterium]
MKKLLGTIGFIAFVIIPYLYASDSDFEQDKKTEQLVESFWQADGSKHYSGEGE